MNMQEGILRYGDIRGQGAEGAAGRWGRLPPRSHGLTVQLSNNVFCHLSRKAFALDLSKAKRTKGINSPGALVCVPGNPQRQAPGWLASPRLQSHQGVGPAQSAVGSTPPAWAGPVQGPGFSSSPGAAVAQTYLVSRCLSGVLGLFLRFAPHG